MTQEALKLALEALEELFDTNGYWWQEVDEQTLEKIDQAITAIKEALAQHDSVQAKPEPEQEPVTWGVDWGKAGDIPCVSIIKRLPDGGIKVLAVEYAPYSYTTPPQRKPLTDDEIAKELYKFEAAGAWYQFARAIEAKLKERNA